MKHSLVSLISFVTCTLAYRHYGYARVEPVATKFESAVTLLDLVSTLFIEDRISNGNPAAENQFPYQVGLSIQSNDTSLRWCGGTLIDRKWVLTAAHCVTQAVNVTVYLGTIVRRKSNVFFTVDASHTIQHSEYNSTNFANDICLIEIPATDLSASIQIAKLPAISSPASTYAGEFAIASGWGKTSDDSSASAELNYVRLQIIENSNCSAIYGPEIVTLNILCVATTGGMSTCLGDSGGPLVLESNSMLVGVTSFVPGEGCTKGYPSGFIRVSSYLEWIKNHTGIFY